MPMLDAFIPEGALPAEAERQLISRLTDLLLEHEGADPQNPVARSLAWVFLHRPAAVYVAGEPATAPRYRLSELGLLSSAAAGSGCVRWRAGRLRGCPGLSGSATWWSVT
jgi:hypothetical protein